MGIGDETSDFELLTSDVRHLKSLSLTSQAGIAIIYTSRRFHIFMRRTTISHFSFLIPSRLSNVIKGRAAPEANSESHIPLLTTSPPRSIIQSYETSDDEEGCLNLFQRDSGRCELPMGQGLSTSEIKMKNLSGSARYRRLKMAGRQFGWYRGCSRPFEDGGRFLLSVY